MDKKFYRNNRNRLFEVMDDNSLIVLYSGELKDKTADEQFLFEVNKNFYYFTGINQDNVMLIMAKSGKEKKEMLFIEENDPVKVKWVGEKLYKDEASMISGIDKVFYHPDFIPALNILLNDKLNGLKTVYLDLEQKNVAGANVALIFEGQFDIEKIVETINKDANNQDKVTISAEDGYRTVTFINGENRAKMMFFDNTIAVIGTEKGVESAKLVKLFY